MVQLSENIISQLMGFYLSAALLLPRLSWFSLISFFKMTSKQHLCAVLIIRSPLVYCFTHSVKCAHNHCKWCVYVCVCLSRTVRHQNRKEAFLCWLLLCLGCRHSHKAECLCVIKIVVIWGKWRGIKRARALKGGRRREKRQRWQMAAL